MYAKYTEVLRDIMLNDFGKQALDKALSTYPLYSTSNNSIKDLIPSREELNKKLLNHYKYREIGFETVGRFLDELEITMCEIMPRYNELLKTVEIMANIDDPFGNVDIVETFEQESTQSAQSEGTSSQSGTASQNGTNSQSMSTDTENSGSSSATINNTANSKQLESDTPQDELSIATKDINDVSYASKATWNESISNGSESRSTSDTSSTESTSEGSNSSNSESSSEGSTSGSSESSGTVKHTLTKKGNHGVNTYAHDMNEFRTSIIDVVNQIITDKRVGELFMLVY